MRDYKDRIALIVGGASGMGLSTAIALAKRGCHVIIADIHHERMIQSKKVIEGLGVECITVECDIRSDESVESMKLSSIAWRGKVDIVMTTAGASLMGPPDAIPVSDWESLFDVNVLGTVRVCNAMLPYLISAGEGHLINTSSIAGKMAYTHTAAPYIASKHAVEGFTEALAIYARANGVGVTSLIPGFVMTNMGEHAKFAGTDEPDKWFELPGFMERTAAEVDEIGDMVLDAVSEGRYQCYTHPHLEGIVASRAKNLEDAISIQVNELSEKE